MFPLLGSLIGIVWFLLTLGMLFNLWKESKKPTLNKILWTGGILFAPVLGPILYMLFGMKGQ